MGCATTQQAPADQIKCSYLGSDCSKLTPGAEGQAALRFVNPAAPWMKYKKVMVQPVTFWGGDDTSVSPADQQMIVDYFQGALTETITKNFEVVTTPGEDVMKVQVAITDTKTATPGLRSISTIIPQARLIGSLKQLATGTYPFVGGAQAEVKITDSVSGVVLAEAVDRRIGTGAMRAGLQWQWGDAENAINAWAQQMDNKLTAWTTGKETAA